MLYPIELAGRSRTVSHSSKILDVPRQCRVAALESPCSRSYSQQVLPRDTSISKSTRRTRSVKTGEPQSRRTAKSKQKGTGPCFRPAVPSASDVLEPRNGPVPGLCSSPEPQADVRRRQVQYLTSPRPEFTFMARLLGPSAAGQTWGGRPLVSRPRFRIDMSRASK
jgi:hypothetical protein